MSQLVLSKTQPGLFPTEAEWTLIREQAQIVLKSGFLPKAIDTPEKAIAIALKGRELGIPLMQAFAHINIIQGKPAISAELMLALIFKNCPGAQIDYLEATGKACMIEARRPGGKRARFGFSLEEAQKANLLSKDSWRNYPGAMLRARAISIVARALFADAIMGCSYTPEELGAEVDDEGNVVRDVASEVSAPAELPKVVPTQPEAGDGIHTPDDPDYIQCGAFAGRRWTEVDVNRLREHIHKVEARLEKAKETGKPIEPKWFNHVERGAAYLESLESDEPKYNKNFDADDPPEGVH